MSLALDRSKGGLQRQIYDGLRQQILSALLPSGARLPASRLMAEQLGVSRNTVLQAYEQLQAEGFVETREGAGTFVADNVAANVAANVVANGQESQRESTTQGKRSVPLSDQAQRVLTIAPALIDRSGSPTELVWDFRYGEPSYDTFPIEAWGRVLAKTARNLSSRDLGYAPVAGQHKLRAALAEYLVRARGLTCDVDDIVVVQGTQEAIDLLMRASVNQGDAVVVEHPFYRGFVRAAIAAGAAVNYVPVDEHGLMTDQLEAAGDARLVCVTPSHQFPTGAVLPVARRMEILRWAAQNNTTILEDDYDAEFRYGGSPIASLQSLDTNESVVYVGTASKTFFPALRIGWMVVPRSLQPTLLKLKSLNDCTPPTLEQLAFAEFIATGQFERHIHRMRKHYAVKRKLLLETLEAALGDAIEVQGSDAGIHVLVCFPQLTPADIAEVVQQCRDVKVGVYGLDSYFHGTPDIAGLLLGYSGVAEPEIRRGAERLIQVLKRVLNRD